MSRYSVGKNEIRNLLQKEASMQDELKSLTNSCDGKIRNFKAIALNKEITKIHNKLRILSFGSNGPDDIA